MSNQQLCTFFAQLSVNDSQSTFSDIYSSIRLCSRAQSSGRWEHCPSVAVDVVTATVASRKTPDIHEL